MSRATRIVRRLGIVLGIVLGAAVVLLVAFFLFLMTPPGENLIARVAVSQINDSIVGEVELENLEFRGDELELYGVMLRTAEGDPVFYAERVLIDLAVGPLFAGEVHLDRLEVSSYDLRLRRVDERWNLADALEGVEPPEVVERVPVVIDALELRHGLIDVQVPVRDEMRQIRIAGVDADGMLEMRDERTWGTVELLAQGLEPAEVPVRVQATALVDDRIRRLQLSAQIGEAEVEGQVGIPAEVDEVGRIAAELDGWLRVDVPPFDLAGFSYGPMRLAAHMSDGWLEVPTARVDLPGARLTSIAPEGDVAFAGTLAISELSTSVRAIEALLPTELPEVSGRGAIELRIDNPMEAPTLELDARLPSIGLGDVQLRGARLGARMHRQEVELDARVSAPHRVRLQMGGEFTDEHREALRIDELALAYPDTRWVGVGEALVRVRDGGPVVEGLVLGSDRQRITADLEWTDERRVGSVTLADVRLRSVPTPLHPPELTFGGLLHGGIEVREREDEPWVQADLRLSHGRMEGVSGISADLSARYERERLQGRVTADLLAGEARARFDLPASMPPEEGVPVAASVYVDGIALSQAWRGLEELVPESLSERVERVSGRMGMWAELGGTWPDPEVRGRFAIREGVVVMPDVGRYHGIELIVGGNEERVRLETLEAHIGEGSLTARGVAERVGDGMRFRYRLDVAADQLPVPLEDPVWTSFDARIEGEITPDHVTSEIQAEDVRVFTRGASAP